MLAVGYGATVALLVFGPRLPAQVDAVRREVRGLEETGAKVGVAVVDLAAGSLWFEHDARVALMPASNQKLLTLAAMLDAVGVDHRFATRFRLCAGVLEVVPSGDPNWTTGGEHDPEHIVAAVAGKLRALGVTSVRGVRIARDTFGDETRPDAWSAYDASLGYCAPSGGLVLDAGCFEVSLTPGGTQTLVRTIAPAIELPVAGTIAVTADRAKGSVYGVAATATGLRAYGALWDKAGTRSVRGAVQDGVGLCERVLAACLQRSGIAIEPTAGERDVAELHTHASPLVLALEPMMKDSSNFHAEQLARALGALVSGDGSFAGGRAAVQAQIEKLVGPWPGLAIDDGSGLSRRNRVSAACLATVLAAAAARPWGEVFVQSLPEGGEGTLRRRLRQPGASCVRAKTGTLRDVSALSGYVDRSDGRRFAFVILVNEGRRGTAAAARWRAAQDRIVAAMDGS